MLQDTVALDALLDFVKGNRGFDFTGYKRASLQRRIGKRMDEVGIADPAEYLDHLEVHPDEFVALFNTILINVTAFFRDEETWQHLADEVAPALLERAGDRPLRIWCAGCASGEEAYTIAMVLAAAMGEIAYRDRVKIYATDVDGDALAAGRAGAYTAKQVEDVPQDHLERCFERHGAHYVFRRDLRRTVIFGPNDLVHDAPISRVDLLSCRNTLMYLNAETQGRVLRRLHFALAPEGLLMLGRCEMLLSHADLFAPVDPKRRLYAKVPAAGRRHRAQSVAGPDGVPECEWSLHLRDRAFDGGPAAQVVVDAHGALVMANASARSLFCLTPADLGRPLGDLDLSHRPVDLHPHLEDVRRAGRHVTLDEARWMGADGGRDRMVQIHLAPLEGEDGVAGVQVTFADVSEQHRIGAQLARSKSELEQAYEELETTVEELESTNEELQSTNEELQSTNEELGISNEDLQSANEELGTMNEELRQRTLELDQLNAFQQAIVGSMGVAVTVVDREQRVQVWSDRAAELWGLRAGEADGRHLLALEIGLPVECLEQPLRDVLDGRASRVELELEATDRRGRAMRCHVAVLGLTVVAGAVSGAVVLMERRDAEG
ncbi:MAG TPA: CheR family methyltransferase [Solirubrobacteraceae bacterium]|nr:CheR family methyltransferase [Solirubrobacteraceae bacterium]